MKGHTLASMTQVAPNGGLIHLLIMFKALFKSTHQISMEDPLVDYSKKIVMTSGHHVVAFEQKMMKLKKTTIWEMNH